MNGQTRKTEPSKGKSKVVNERRDRGQSIIEMAFALPILLLLLAVVIDAARAFDAYIVLTNSAREGARFGTVIEPEPSITDIKQLVVDDVLGSGTNITHMNDFSASNVDVDMGTRAVTVTVSYEFDLWFGGLVGVSSFQLEKQSAMPMYYTD